MSDFAGIEDLLQDFLPEAADILSGIENKLVGLEINSQDHGLLNDIFGGFRTIKGGAGFLNASELVTLCQLTENLFDKLRHGEMAVTRELMDVVLDVTGAVREMFGHLACGVQPPAADAGLLARLKAALAGQFARAAASAVTTPVTSGATTAAVAPDWSALFAAVTSPPATAPAADAARDGVVVAPTLSLVEEKTCDDALCIDTARLDRVLNLSGEIGLTKNRLMALRSDILNGCNDSEALPALDQAVSQLDLLVSDLQNAVIKTHRQPLADFRPKGIASVTTLSNGQIVLILDMNERFAELGENRDVPRSAFIPAQQAAA